MLKDSIKNSVNGYNLEFNDCKYVSYESLGCSSDEKSIINSVLDNSHILVVFIDYFDDCIKNYLESLFDGIKEKGNNPFFLLFGFLFLESENKCMNYISGMNYYYKEIKPKIPNNITTEGFTQNNFALFEKVCANKISEFIKNNQEKINKISGKKDIEKKVIESTSNDVSKLIKGSLS